MYLADNMKLVKLLPVFVNILWMENYIYRYIFLSQKKSQSVVRNSKDLLKVLEVMLSFRYRIWGF